MEEQLEVTNSSHVSACAYDRDTHLLRVQYKDGSVYAFLELHPDGWERLKAAESKGKFIAALSGRKVSHEDEGSRELQSFDEDDCCAQRIRRAMKSGKLDACDSWVCPACGTEWKPEQHGPVKHWKPITWMELL